MKRLPTKPEAEQILLRLVNQYFDGRLPGKPDHENKIELWRWDNTQQIPVRMWLDTFSAPIAFAARLAGELVVLAPENKEYRRWHLAAILDAAKLATGWDQPLAQGAGTPFALAAAHRDSWDDVLRFTSASGHAAATVAMLEVIGAAGDSSVGRTSGTICRRQLRNGSSRVLR
jgi:hypothetical protein